MARTRKPVPAALPLRRSARLARRQEMQPKESKRQVQQKREQKRKQTSAPEPRIKKAKKEKKKKTINRAQKPLRQKKRQPVTAARDGGHQHNKETGDEVTKSNSDSPSLTDAYVRSLLPASMFGLADGIFARGLWSVDHERAMRQQFAASADFRRFYTAQLQLYTQCGSIGSALLDAELRLWEVLQHRFRCGLNDFYRYGLRPSFADVSPSTPAHVVVYCQKLAMILMHPIWSADIAPVRWLLQRAVQERVHGHARPLVPPYSYWRRPFVDTARQWAFDTSMRMSLDEGVAEVEGRDKGKKMPNLASLSQASSEAARAATEAEAEMAWFLFSASAPRDLWLLDRGLDHIDEPGSGGGEEDDASNSGDSDDTDSEEDSSSSSPPPFGLKVCDAIRNGYFGALADSYSDCEATERQDNRRREDNLGERTRRAKAARARPGSDSTSRSAAPLDDDQAFFDLRIEDLDRVIGLLAQSKFISSSGFATPECYYAGYIKAHAMYGYGTQPGGSTEQKGTQPLGPMLTCLRCAQRYHQGVGREHHHDDGDSDSDDDHTDDGHHGHSHGTIPASHDHDHHLHEQFVRDVAPDRMVEWLLLRKCEWLLAGQRERQIQLALQAALPTATTNGQKSSIALLPDVPPFDPAPMGHEDRIFTHPSQLVFLERSRQPEQRHASALWCLWDSQGTGESIEQHEE